MIRIFAIFLLGILFPLVGTSFAADSEESIHVDPLIGKATNDGRNGPVKTIARAIKLAQPGDTIFLAPGIYHESADFSNKHGQPGKPITLDGRGAVLEGSELVTSKDWRRISSGLYRGDDLYEEIDDSIIARWFLVWDGQMNRMGRSPKGRSQSLETSTGLQVGEWTYSKRYEAFFLLHDPKKSLDDAGIRFPARSSGVILSGSGSWLTIKNVIATHFYDDGFNIQGKQRNIVFENITAIECGDDGFSANDDSVCEINGFVSIGNATGICDTGTSKTHYKNVLIKDCVGYDLYFIGKDHSLENAIVESSGYRTFWVEGSHLKADEICNLRMANVKINRTDPSPQELRIASSSFVRAEKCRFAGLNVTVTPGGGADFRNCYFVGYTERPEKPDILIFPEATWKGADNRYDIRSLRVDKTSYTQETFGEFQTFTGSEKNSKWGGLLPHER